MRANSQNYRWSPHFLLLTPRVFLLTCADYYWVVAVVACSSSSMKNHFYLKFHIIRVPPFFILHLLSSDSSVQQSTGPFFRFRLASQIFQAAPPCSQSFFWVVFLESLTLLTQCRAAKQTIALVCKRRRSLECLSSKVTNCCLMNFFYSSCFIMFNNKVLLL